MAAESQTKTIPTTETESFVGIYTMFFRQHTNHMQSKNFRCAGNLKQARERAEEHCNIIGAKLNFVQPLISDLWKEEQFHLGATREGAGIESQEVKK